MRSVPHTADTCLVGHTAPVPLGIRIEHLRCTNAEKSRSVSMVTTSQMEMHLDEEREEDEGDHGGGNAVVTESQADAESRAYREADPHHPQPAAHAVLFCCPVR